MTGVRIPDALLEEWAQEGFLDGIMGNLGTLDFYSAVAPGMVEILPKQVKDAYQDGLALGLFWGWLLS